MGTRLAEETGLRPKPMLEIGGRPLLWHIMSIYAHHGFSDFVVACGYLGEVIRRYFHDFHAYSSDFTVNLADGTHTVLRSNAPDWRVTVMDTGVQTMTGGRLKRLAEVVGDATFMCTYGDGVANVDVRALVEFHRSHGRLATLTAVRPPARFGALSLEEDRVTSFQEKPQIGEGWINGGFFVFDPGILDHIAGDDISLEREPLEALASADQLRAFRHEGFWQPMDTLREKRMLERMWDEGRAPWRVWE